MDAPNVGYEVKGPIALVTLDRPRQRNAQSWSLLDELDAALDRAQSDREVRVVVVRGAGDHFSAGHDLGTPEQLEDMRRRGTSSVGVEEYDVFRHYNLDLTLKWRDLPKPTNSTGGSRAMRLRDWFSRWVPILRGRAGDSRREASR